MTAEAKSEERALEYIIDAQGNKKYVLLPIEEYEAMIEKLEDARDIQLAQERRGGETISLEELKKQLGR
jgi:PHD/YefM family antitoxin component YafN of YafNO toxin-antitoxin module